MFKEARIFETQNVDLASYLLMEGIKLLEIQKSDRNPKIAVIRFIDEKSNCLDLERTYLNSEFKKYRDINKYLLSKIYEALRQES
jgi:hypothetical protein